MKGERGSNRENESCKESNKDNEGWHLKQKGKASAAGLGHFAANTAESNGTCFKGNSKKNEDLEREQKGKLRPAEETIKQGNKGRQKKQ